MGGGKVWIAFLKKKNNWSNRVCDWLIARTIKLSVYVAWGYKPLYTAMYVLSTFSCVDLWA